MRQKMLKLLLIVVALGTVAPAAMSFPYAWYQFNDETPFVIPDNAWTRDQHGDWVTTFRTEDLNGRFTFSGNLEIAGDPQTLFGISTSNHTVNPAVFTLSITNNFAAPLNGPNQVYGAFGGHVTDGRGDGAQILAINPKMQVTSLDPGGVNMGVDVGNSFTTGPGFPGQVYDIGTDSKGPQAGPVDGWTAMTTLVKYSLSGRDDVAVLTGSAIILPQPIPEPASALLLVPGLLGLAAWRMRKREV